MVLGLLTGVTASLRHKGNYKNGKKEGAWVQYNGDGTPVVDDTGIFEDGVSK